MKERKIMLIHDIVEENGKTIKENNLARKHNIPIGSLVEITDSGARLFIVYHTRDCDGTPLYYLCHNKENTVQEKAGFRNHEWIGGYSEPALKKISWNLSPLNLP